MAGGIVGSIVGQLASQMVSQIATQAISSLIAQFGSSNILGALTNIFQNAFGNALKGIIDNSPLPQFLKDAAKSVIDDVLSKNQMQTTPEAQSAVEESDAGVTAADMANQTAKRCGKKADEGEGSEGANWLVALAAALGEMQGDFMDDAMQNMDTMKNNGKKSKAFITAQNEFSANMQMFSMMANASSTAIKALGEGLTALARKQ
jgi:hypothetical protein